MKLRFLLMGLIITALSSIFIFTRGYSPALAGFAGVGVVLLVIGAIRK